MDYEIDPLYITARTGSLGELTETEQQVIIKRATISLKQFKTDNCSGCNDPLWLYTKFCGGCGLANKNFDPFTVDDENRTICEEDHLIAIQHYQKLLSENDCQNTRDYLNNLRFCDECGVKLY